MTPQACQVDPGPDHVAQAGTSWIARQPPLGLHVDLRHRVPAASGAIKISLVSGRVRGTSNESIIHTALDED